MEDNEALDQAKVRIASQFLLQSPPGEFNEVFNDVRTLLNNDGLLKKGCAQAIADYNKDQFVPVKIDGVEAPTMITKHNELKDGHFVDPKSGKVFKYDHLRKDATEVVNSPPADVHEALESWRKTLQIEADDYIAKHYERTGVATVFVVGRLEVVLCIESHLFQPKNFWSGRWRSEWRIPVFDDDQHHRKVATLKCTGRIRLQVHYYEDGNVQQISNKNATLDLKLTAGDIATAAKDVIKAICENESIYQKAILESYATMSDTMFKALRRPLPITRSKFDWTKVQTYRIAEDIKQQPPQS